MLWFCKGVRGYNARDKPGINENKRRELNSADKENYF